MSAPGAGRGSRFAPPWTQPGGAHQRFGYLLAAIALDATDPRLGDLTFTDRPSEATLEGLSSPVSPNVSVFTVAARLVDAVVWRHRSPIAHGALQVLIEHFRLEYGVLIDPGLSAITVDPGFDPGPRLGAQRDLLAQRLAGDVRAEVLTELSAAGMTATALSAVETTLAAGQDAGAVDDALRVAGAGEIVRARVAFIIGYLSGTADLDFAGVPALVDVVTEAEGIIQSWLANPDLFGDDDWSWEIPGELFTDTQRWAQLFEWPSYRRDVSLLAAGDRARVEAAMRAGATGRAVPVLWPGHADRPDLDLRVRRYCRTVAMIRSYAQTGTTDLVVGPALEYEQIIVLAADLARESVALPGHARAMVGLAGVEVRRVLATMARAEIGQTEPALRLLGELHNHDTETQTLHRIPYQLAARCEEELTAMAGAAGITVTESTGLYQLGRTIRALAEEPGGTATGDHRRAMVRSIARLTTLGTPAAVMLAMQHTLGTYRDAATAHANHTAHRHTMWDQRIQRVSDQQRSDPAPDPDPGTDLLAAVLPDAHPGPGPGPGSRAEDAGLPDQTLDTEPGP